MSSRWPRTRPVDRAREVARTCWRALSIVDPNAAELIAQAAREAGEAWLTPQAAQFGPDDLVTASEAAELVGMSVRWAYEWATDRDRRGVVIVRGRGGRESIRIRVRDLLESVAQERRAQPTSGESPSAP